MDVDAALASLQGGGGRYREVVRPVLLQQFGMSYSSLPLSSRGVDLLVCRGFGWQPVIPQLGMDSVCGHLPQRAHLGDSKYSRPTTFL